MKVIMYSVYDNVANYYAPPFQMKNIAEAMRAFTDITNRQDSAINQHPQDYYLYEFGEFDNVTGEFELHELPKKVACATDVHTPSPQQQLQMGEEK